MNVAVFLVLLLVVAEAAAQSTDSPRPPSTASPDTSSPGFHRFEIKPDTPAERAAFLVRRRTTLEQQKIETVAPLPAQSITPSPSPASQQR